MHPRLRSINNHNNQLSYTSIYMCGSSSGVCDCYLCISGFCCVTCFTPHKVLNVWRTKINKQMSRHKKFVSTTQKGRQAEQGNAINIGWSTLHIYIYLNICMPLALFYIFLFIYIYISAGIRHLAVKADVAVAGTRRRVLVSAWLSVAIKAHWRLTTFDCRLRVVCIGVLVVALPASQPAS